MYERLILACLIVSISGTTTPTATKDYLMMLRKGVGQDLHQQVAYASKGRTIRVRNVKYVKATLTSVEKATILDLFGNVVERVEEDEKTVLAASIAPQHDAAWGLRRIQQNTPTLHKNYHHDPSWGSNPDITVHVVDSGVKCDHSDLINRCTHGLNLVTTETNLDNSGHGTHVASIIAGTRFGVAKSAKIVSVKVLNRDGLGSISDVIQGLEWITNNTNSVPSKTVINMSLGTTYSASLNSAVAEAITSGFHVVTASGNRADDACGYSPASVSTAITVGASGLDVNGDFRLPVSNYGSCVDIMAPGVFIPGAGISSSTDVAVRNGTSMAAPHVAGILAVKLSTSGVSMTPADLKNWVLASGTTSVFAGQTGTGSPDLMARLPSIAFTPVYPDEAATTENCFGVFEAQHGALQGTINFPETVGAPYKTNDLKCWRIKCAGQLTLSYTRFSFESNYDWLFTNNKHATGFIPPVYPAIDGNALIRMESDGVQPEYGFTLDWNCVSANTTDSGIQVKFTTGTDPMAKTEVDTHVTLWFSNGDSVSDTFSGGRVSGGSSFITFPSTEHTVNDLLRIDVTGTADAWMIQSVEVMGSNNVLSQWVVPSLGFLGSSWIGLDGGTSVPKVLSFTPIPRNNVQLKLTTDMRTSYHGSEASFTVELGYFNGQVQPNAAVFTPGDRNSFTVNIDTAWYPTSAVDFVSILGSSSTDGWYLNSLAIDQSSYLIDEETGSTSMWMKVDRGEVFKGLRRPSNRFDMTCTTTDPSQGIFDISVTSLVGEEHLVGHFVSSSTGTFTFSSKTALISEAEVMSVKISTQGVSMGGYDSLTLSKCTVGNVVFETETGSVEFTVDNTVQEVVIKPPVGQVSSDTITVFFTTGEQGFSDSNSNFAIEIVSGSGDKIHAGSVSAPRFGINSLTVQHAPFGPDSVYYVRVMHGGSDGWEISKVEVQSAIGSLLPTVTSGGSASSWVDGDGKSSQKSVNFYPVPMSSLHVRVQTGGDKYHNSKNTFHVTLVMLSGGTTVFDVVPSVLKGVVYLDVPGVAPDEFVSVNFASTGGDGWFISSVRLQLSSAEWAALKTDKGSFSTWCDGDSNQADIEEVTFVAP
eukprot:TRINITY_DN3606_c1_g1_i1.p1 TRINITY_DN3606_c1_g1~~TRINITY_DN3606_c1_g1_i1.p1  ORF type:complete len:1118 (+),score=169.75 TRINITY_DN3606_c1_g1_i1:70-3354(+)